MIESLIKPEKAKKFPALMLLISIIYVSIAILLSLWVFPGDPSLAAVFLTTMALIPFMVRILKNEEKEEMHDLVTNEKGINIHKKVLFVFLFLWIGLTIGYTIWCSLLPEEVYNQVFNSQLTEIRIITRPFTGNAITPEMAFNIIVLNNIKVMMFCLLFSFLFGAGAAFILTWNASVVATAIGSFIRSQISISYFGAVPIAFGKYLIHGIPETIAYFMAAIAGGLISAAIVKEDFKSKKFIKLIINAIDMIVLAIIFVIISGLIEISISPLIR